MSAYGVVEHSTFPNYWIDDEGHLRADDSQLTHAEFAALTKAFRDRISADLDALDIVVEPIYFPQCCSPDSAQVLDTKHLYARPGRFIAVEGMPCE